MIKYFHKYFKWLIVSACIIVFVFLVRALLHDNLKEFDELIYNFVISFKSDYCTMFFNTITFFASAPFLIVVSLFLFFFFKNKKYGIFSMVNLGVIVFINQTLKLIFSRPRPEFWMLISENGFSFPSGHAMASVGFYGMVIYLICRTNIKSIYKYIISVLLIILVFFICVSRIYLGVHYASDIIAGFTLSVSYLIIAISIVEFYLKKKNG